MYDDAKVCEISPAIVLKQNAYMLYYKREKIDPSENGKLSTSDPSKDNLKKSNEANPTPSSKLRKSNEGNSKPKKPEEEQTPEISRLHISFKPADQLQSINTTESREKASKILLPDMVVEKSAESQPTTVEKEEKEKPKQTPPSNNVETATYANLYKQIEEYVNQKQTTPVTAPDSGKSLKELTTATTKKVERKVGRNETCPCGSGKKYKNCHGAR